MLAAKNFFGRPTCSLLWKAAALRPIAADVSRACFATLPHFSKLPGPSMEEYYGALMKNHGTDYHLLISDFCDKHSKGGMIQIPNVNDPLRNNIVVANPDLVASVYQRQEFLDRPIAHFLLYAYAHLAQEDPSKVNGNIQEAIDSLGKEGHHGIATRNGANWEKHRRIANKALLSPKAVANFANQMNTSSKELVETFKRESANNPGGISIYDLLGEYTFSVIVQTALGTEAMNFATREGQTIYRSVKSFFNAARVYSFKPYPYEDTAELEALRNNLTELREIFIKLLEEKRKNPEKSNDFATVLFTTKDEVTGSYLDSTQVLTDTLDIVNGGTDTTSSLLAFGLHLLAHHPELADQARQEVLSVLKERHGSTEADITNDDLAKMPFLTATVKEILRLFPSAPVGGRATNKDIELGGYEVPAATNVIISNWNVQRNPDYWPDPLEFKPDRFINNKGHPFAWIPFGAGARSCIGQRISMSESRIALAYLLRAFDILPSNEELGKPYTAPGHLFGISLQPSAPIKINFSPRS